MKSLNISVCSSIPRHSRQAFSKNRLNTLSLLRILDFMNRLVQIENTMSAIIETQISFGRLSDSQYSRWGITAGSIESEPAANDLPMSL
jgi:hypothetical protein